MKLAKILKKRRDTDKHGNRIKQHYWVNPQKSRPIKTIPEGDYISERKYDGERLLVFKDGKVSLVNARKTDQTMRYPEIAEAARNIKGRNALLDGEIVHLSNGKDSFPLLSGRSHLLDTEEIKRRSRNEPLTYIAFDILMNNGRDLKNLPLSERKKILDAAIPDNLKRIKEIRYSRNLKKMLDKAEKNNWEGIVFKLWDSKYTPGARNMDWQKLKLSKVGDFKIVGSTKGTGKRKKYFGALKLASWDKRKKKLVPRGKVGSVMGTEEQLKAITERLKSGKPSYAKVRYSQVGSRGSLREPRLEGIRTDIKDKETHL